MEAVTFRNVAWEAGFKSAVVSHYFKDKKEMLIFSFETIWKGAADRVFQETSKGRDLATCLDSLLPASPKSFLDWQAWFGFWSTATNDPDLAALRVAAVTQSDTTLTQALEGAKANGELPADLDTAFHASRIQMVLIGIATMAVVEPKRWPPKAQRAMFRAELDLMKSMSEDCAEAS